mgnify:CR=1 FL=1
MCCNCLSVDIHDRFENRSLKILHVGALFPVVHVEVQMKYEIKFILNNVKSVFVFDFYSLDGMPLKFLGLIYYQS